MELLSRAEGLAKGASIMRYDKSARQRLIQKIVAKAPVQTQEELSTRLAEHGVIATQATVSRDIKELGLTKVAHQEGYRYSLAAPGDQPGALDRLRRLLHEMLVDVVTSENIVVVKTLSGGANVVSEAIDRLEWEDVAGTLAGDNTVLVVARQRESSAGIAERLLSLS